MRCRQFPAGRSAKAAARLAAVAALVVVGFAMAADTVGEAVSEGANTVPGCAQIRSGKNIRYEGAGEVGGLLCFGSSYAWHGPSPAIGWHGDWGMAASAREKDCVHRLWDAVRKVRPDAPLCIVQSAYWERNYTGDVELLERAYGGAKSFRADWICIIGTGANAPRELAAKEPLDGHYDKMVDFFVKMNPQAKVVVTVGSGGAAFEKSVREFAAKRGYPVVSNVEALAAPGMRATGLFEHKGVAWHPSDRGMAELARRYAVALGLKPADEF